MSYTSLANTHSVYIHWPFCPYKCNFCPFVALASQDNFMEVYHRALCKEITKVGSQNAEKADLDTIYIGGGTPSTYPDELLLDTFGILRNVFNFDESTEVTIELNPGTVRPEQLALWKKAGINRLSIGVQSLNDSVLKKLNRHQKAEDVFFVLKHAQKVFDNISIDAILGLPGVSADEWKAFLAQAVTWPIKHLSMYFLMVHENTPLYFGVKKNKITLPPDDEIVDLYYWSIEFLAQHGFKQYEISNFAREGYESRHNSMYWHRKPYRAFGLGACSFDGKKRYQNEKNLMKYIHGIENDKSVCSFEEELSREQVHLEKVMLGLRQTRGIEKKEILGDHLTVDEKKKLGARIVSLQENGFVVEQNGNLSLTPKGLAVENDIVVKLSL